VRQVALLVNHPNLPVDGGNRCGLSGRERIRIALPPFAIEVDDAIGTGAPDFIAIEREPPAKIAALRPEVGSSETMPGCAI